MMRIRTGRSSLLFSLLCSSIPWVAAPAYAQNNAAAAQEADRLILPPPVAPFRGKIAPAANLSKPDFPKLVSAPAGAPNVVLIMTDDIGFGAASTFGGPIPTPNLDRLANRGLRYNRFHTAALCSPTRAALLTGRNHHAVGMGVVTDMATGYPGYASIIPKTAATVAEILRQNGYNTAMFGKHHNVPIWESSAAGPFDRWPTGLGFEYFYGFIGGETSQWNPALFRGTSRVAPPDTDRADSVLDRFLADDAIHWIHEQKASAPDKPFFLYYAPGTGHSPHHAPADWIAKFKGRFDQGWDALRAETVSRQKANGLIPPDTQVTPRSEGLPAWSSLSPQARKMATGMTEVFAGMIAFQDAQIGRLLDEIDRMGQADNTLVLFIEGDNGTSSEGGVEGTTNWGATIAGGGEDQAWRFSQLDLLGSARTYEHFPTGWAWALDAPFPWFKQVASHLGGTRNPLVVSWPGHITQRGIRSQFHHVVDILPTILEAAHIPPPSSVNGIVQQPMDGISFAYSFADAGAAGQRKTQYFELFGNRGIYHAGWWAGTTPHRAPWISNVPPGDITKWPWELYDITTDFAQANNLAARYPDKLKSLQRLWQQEAERNHVFPLDDSTISRVRNNPYNMDRSDYVYWGTDLRIPDESAPPIRRHSFTVTADVDIPPKGGNGVLIASGGAFGGWSFYLRDGRPAAIQIASQQPRDQFRVQSSKRIKAGPARITFAFTRDPQDTAGRGGNLSISVDGVQAAAGRFERVADFQAEATETFDIGNDTGTMVAQEYAANPRFDGTINKIVVHIPRNVGK